MDTTLTALGWDIYRSSMARLELSDAELERIGRVSAVYQGMIRITTETGECFSQISGRLRHHVERREQLPAVGDWVVFRQEGKDSQALIERVLPRKSKFSRKQAGTVTEEQVAAANVDLVFIVMALNQDFNLNRLERYLITAWDSGAEPVIVLTKADVCSDLSDLVAATESIAFGVPIIVTSVVTGSGISTLKDSCPPRHTGVFLGSSGVGKSSLINALLGEDRQTVKAVRADDHRGRHTTTHREMITTPYGAVLIDTPGMRELQIWDHGGAVDAAFADVESIASECQFNDCSHGSEPNCAIQQALDQGTLSQSRWNHYQKLQAEAVYLQRKDDVRAQLAHKKKWKKIAKMSNQRI